MNAPMIAGLLLHFLVFCFVAVFIALMAQGFHKRAVLEAERNRLRPAREILKRRFALGQCSESSYRETLAALDAE
ncbi:MAG: hypothetical protein WCL50_06170 [Spirochaetota bacterium]